MNVPLCKTFVKHIGNTPMIYLKHLSEQTGNYLFGKAEFFNPGESIKDRTALGLILEAEQKKWLRPGMTIYEGTAGNTGIGLALLSKQRNYKCHIVMPDNQSQEKYDILKAYGVQLTTVPATSFSNPGHFYHMAAKMAHDDPQGYWLNQFENEGNSKIHYQTTGPEIDKFLKGKIDFFASSSGTGGSLGGISSYLKKKNKNIKCYLIDPLGSGLYSYVKSGVIATEGSSITEGIGIMRITANFKRAILDDAIRVTDEEMLLMMKELIEKESLFVGLSSALNVAGLKKISQQFAHKGLIGVTLLCDRGSRYFSKIRHYLVDVESSIVY